MKDLKYLLLLACFTVFAAQAEAQEFMDCSGNSFADVKLDRKTTKIDDHAVISLPIGWEQSPPEPGSNVVISATGNFATGANINVVVKTDPAFKMLTAYDLADQNIFLRAGAKAENMITAKQYSHNGVPALYAHYFSEGDGEVYDAQQLAVLHKGKLYMLTMMGDKESAPCLYEIFDFVRMSLKFN